MTLSFNCVNERPRCRGHTPKLVSGFPLAHSKDLASPHHRFTTISLLWEICDKAYFGPLHPFVPPFPILVTTARPQVIPIRGGSQSLPARPLLGKITALKGTESNCLGGQGCLLWRSHPHPRRHQALGPVNPQRMQTLMALALPLGVKKGLLFFHMKIKWPFLLR